MKSIAPMMQLKALVTRPQQQSEKLCVALRAQGIIPLPLPALAINAAKNSKKLQSSLNELHKMHFAIFISPNAVHYSLAYLNPESIAALKQLKIAAIGSSTADALLTVGLTVDLLPRQQFNSEGLLALAELQNLAHQNVIIFCGSNSRQHLAESLKQRGATVTQAIVYQCSKPKQLAVQLAALIDTIDIIIVTSQQSLDNLWHAAKPRQKDLCKIPLIVSSEHLKSYAQKLNFKQVIRAENATDIALCTALKQWKQAHD